MKNKNKLQEFFKNMGKNSKNCKIKKTFCFEKTSVKQINQ